MVTDTVLASRDFAGLHFTGSTHVFKDIWAKMEPSTIKHTQNCRETGGKISSLLTLITQNKLLLVCVVHLNFKVKMFSSFKILRTKSLWPAIKEQIITDVKSMKMGSPEDFSNFITVFTKVHLI
jgi:1-pyrroline-5-carboxylate dehydrogenase